jgi:hypothetical protein
VLVTLTVLTASFALTRLSGDLAISIAGPQATSEDIETIRKAYGLNRPVVVQFGDWVVSAATGDLGRSYLYHEPVARLIAARMPTTLTLGLCGLVVALGPVRSPQRPRRLASVVLGMVMLISVLHLISLDLGFRTWRGHLATAVHSTHGVVPFAQSGLSRAEFERYGWAWTTPVQSTLLMTAPGQGIILNPAPTWSPFGPRLRHVELDPKYLHP